MSLHVRCAVPARAVDVRIDVHDGETVALMGPNGAGKSTVVEFAAGIVRGDGVVCVDGVDLTGVDTYRRNIGLLTQDALLLPHLTVAQNVAFGPRSRKGIPRSQVQSTVSLWLDRLDLTALADRRPHQLSGGQAQRVALARALAVDPRVVLLDEPMAALDVTAVPVMRAMLREHLADRTCVVITHDVVDASVLADRVVLLSEGRVCDLGPPRTVLTGEHSPFAATIAEQDITWRSS